MTSSPVSQGQMGIEGLPTSPQPRGAGGTQETSSSQAREENQGQATGVFTAAAGTFHRSLRGAVVSIAFDCFCK